MVRRGNLLRIIVHASISSLTLRSNGETLPWLSATRSDFGILLRNNPKTAPVAVFSLSFFLFLQKIILNNKRMTLLTIGWPEILLIALIVLLLFGAKKIPELMKGLGKGVKSFKDGMNGVEEPEIKEDKEKKE